LGLSLARRLQRGSTNWLQEAAARIFLMKAAAGTLNPGDVNELNELLQ